MCLVDYYYPYCLGLGRDPQARPQDSLKEVRDPVVTYFLVPSVVEAGHYPDAVPHLREIGNNGTGSLDI